MQQPLVTIYLIRHGNTDYNLEKRVQGQEIDVDINNIGRVQAILTGKYLKKYRPDVNNTASFYCSPLIRTKTTLELILKELNLSNPNKVILDDALKERKQGILSGIYPDDPLQNQVNKYKEKYNLEYLDPIENSKNITKMYSNINQELNLNYETNDI